MLTVDGVDTGSTTITVSASEGTKLHGGQRLSERCGAVCDYHSGWIPSQKGTLTYNGEAQMAEWNDLNTEELTLVGASYQTNAGLILWDFNRSPDISGGTGLRRRKMRRGRLGRQ